MVAIESVAFEGEFAWPVPIRAVVTRMLTQRKFDANTEWTQELENLVRGVLQDRGYFHSKPHATVKVLKDNSIHPRVSVILRDDYLELYRVAEIHIKNAKEDDPKLAFPRDQLRALIPLRSGEVFSVGKVREGLEALRRLYCTKGYIDYTATPLTELDSGNHRVWLTLEIDEQRQFLIDKVEIFGLKLALEKQLRERVKLGAPLNYKLIESFYKENKSVLPTGATVSNLRIDRDLQNATAKLLFDFRPCPPLATPPAADQN